MRKILSTIALISALFALAPLESTDVSAVDLKVNPILSNTEFQTAQDKDFTTTIFVPESSNIASFEAVLNYDVSAVSLVKATPCKDNGEQLK